MELCGGKERQGFPAHALAARAAGIQCLLLEESHFSNPVVLSSFKAGPWMWAQAGADISAPATALNIHEPLNFTLAQKSGSACSFPAKPIFS